ncbi:hypothetical protein B0J11DRAFT_620453 [Dendryphion nanum]|uniref:NmrA-like domain-containing protein n=1 Tax=Dendryphion nanum TaxID=256645 RepID=A0A9P9I7I6_9PLEO|nr:hypothetical protein B0J11DRAFT_620453 [Dendryphion nanum]
MSSKIIAVAGGTGNIGRAIVEELIAHGGYKIFILARAGSHEKSKELGCPILAIDYSNQSSLISALELNGIDTVISTLSSGAGADPELALIKAAEASKITRRYIASIWGVRYTADVAKYYTNAHAKMSALAALESSSLEYTSVLNGFFLDYFGIPHIKSYLPSFPFVIDMANNAASIPASGDAPIVFTYSFDVGRFVGKLLSESKWEKESVVIGDQITWNQFLALAEDVKGTKFSVSHDSLELLHKGQITELPGHKELYPFFPKETLQGAAAVFSILMEKGFVNLEREGSLNERYKDVKVKTVRQLVEEAWKGK